MKTDRRRRRLQRLGLVGSIALFMTMGTVLAGAASAKSGLPPNTSGDPRATYTAGNIHDGDCSGGTSDITSFVHFTVDGSNTYITLVAPFPAMPFKVFVKGGPAYNTYNFTGTHNVPGPPPTLSTTVPGDVTNLHSPVNNGGNIAQISHFFICGTIPYFVHVGYADNLHLLGGVHVPSIWQGNVNGDFVGCNHPVSPPCTNVSPVHHPDTCPLVAGQGAFCYDAGAIRLDNNTASPIQLSSVTVNIGGCVFNPWSTESQATMTIPAGKSLILTQTGGTGPNVGCGVGPDPQTGFNFDTSDSTTGLCSNNGLIPEIDVTVTGGATTSFFDNGQILNTGGFDPSCKPGHFDQNEGHDWSAAL